MPSKKEPTKKTSNIIEQEPHTSSVSLQFYDSSDDDMEFDNTTTFPATPCK